MFDFLKKTEFFKVLFGGEKSGATARERLRLVLLSDHLALAPDVVDALKAELLTVIARYVDIDPNMAEVTFEQRERELAMLASVPIKSVRKDRPSAPKQRAANGRAHAPLNQPPRRRRRRRRPAAATPSNGALPEGTELAPPGTIGNSAQA
jgi:cell division topological specificity factor